jgi:adenine-specific DNA glycosylase
MLIQERYRKDPWKVLASCILLNRVVGRTAEPIIDEFFRRYPTPAHLLNGSRLKIIAFLRPLGFYHTREKNLREMTKCFLRGVPFDQLPGIGKYGQDSYQIFVEGNRKVNPDDEKLKAYLKGEKL